LNLHNFCRPFGALIFFLVDLSIPGLTPSLWHTSFSFQANSSRESTYK
jgi:hypothetical protein